MKNASGSEITPGTAAGSHSATGASRTSDMSRGPSTNAPKISRAEYVNVAIAPIVAATSSTTTPASASGASVNASSMPSLDRKPSVGGIAAIDAAPITIDPKVHGIRFHSGPRRRMSRVPA